MSVDGDYHLGETFVDLQTNIERKRYALEILDAEYNKICLKSESNLKSIEELASKMYNLSSNLKSMECRVVEYEKKEKDWEKESNNLQKSIDELKIAFGEEKSLSDKYDIDFDEHVLKLVEDAHKDRDFYINSSTGEQTDNLNDANSSIAQETSDIKQALIEIKQKNPFDPSQEPEIKKMEDVKKLKIEKLEELKKVIFSLEREIKQLSA